MSGAVILFFSFFDCALVADIETGATQNAFALIDLIGNADIDAPFGAEERTSATGNTSVRNEVELTIFLIIHKYPPLRFLGHILSCSFCEFKYANIDSPACM